MTRLARRSIRVEDVKSRDIDARIQANASVLSEGVRTLNGAVRVADHIQVNSG